MDEHVSAPKLKSIGVIALATYCVRPQPGVVVRSREKILGLHKNVAGTTRCIARTQEVTTVFDQIGYLVLLGPFHNRRAPVSCPRRSDNRRRITFSACARIVP